MTSFEDKPAYQLFKPGVPQCPAIEHSMRRYEKWPSRLAMPEEGGDRSELPKAVRVHKVGVQRAQLPRKAWGITKRARPLNFENPNRHRFPGVHVRFSESIPQTQHGDVYLKATPLIRCPLSRAFAIEIPVNQFLVKTADAFEQTASPARCGADYGNGVHRRKERQNKEVVRVSGDGSLVRESVKKFKVLAASDGALPATYFHRHISNGGLGGGSEGIGKSAQIPIGYDLETFVAHRCVQGFVV